MVKNMAEGNEATAPSDVAKVLDTANQILAVAKGLAALTSTPLDDTIVMYAQKAVDFVTPFAAEPWFLDLVDWVKTKLVSGNPAVAAAELKAMFAK
jgi:hypothetical protein